MKNIHRTYKAGQSRFISLYSRMAYGLSYLVAISSCIYSCSESFNTENKDLQLPYKVTLHETSELVFANVPRQISQFAGNVLLKSADGKFIASYNKVSGQLIKQLTIDDLPLEGIFEKLINLYELEVEIGTLLESEFSQQGTKFYSFISSDKLDRKLQVVLSTMVPFYSRREYKGKMSKMTEWQYKSMILTLNNDLELLGYDVFDGEGLSAKGLSSSNCSEWIVKNNIMLAPLQYTNNANLHYNFAAFRKTKDRYRLVSVDSSEKLEGIATMQTLSNGNFDRFGWSVSGNHVSIGKTIYDCSVKNDFQIDFEPKWAVNDSQGLIQFIMRDQALYYQTGHPQVTDTIEYVEVKQKSLGNEKGESEIVFKGPKRYLCTNVVFDENGFYFVHKKKNMLCELVFTPY